jgi:uncharacterized protein YecE (DUF72 family)
MKTDEDIVWRIGCSGFHYKEWKGVFYPEGLPQKKWFEYYCEHFDTLELNVTFYRFPELSSLQGWYEKSPSDFFFSVKAPRIITHYKKFNDTDGQVRDFYGVVREGLKEKLGCILFQLPPDLTYSPEVLTRITEQMDASFQNVIEFRHSSWWNEQVFQTLTNRGISFCGISYPGLPDKVMCNTDTVYYRYHGIPRLYFSAYSKDFLQQTTADIRKNTHVRKAYLYFNNTAELAALRNANYLQKILLKRESN